VLQQEETAMPVERKAQELGAFSSSEIALFWRVYDATMTPGESVVEAEHRASRIIANYQLGITDEDELIELSRRALGR
jgi:hypothetical protein